MAKRKYTLKQRAAQQQQTRARIVQAVMELHQEVGPARTTIRAVAERAGVERLTVYRHFPDEASLFGACAARFTELNPPPDPAQWQALPQPRERLRGALGALYAHYGRTQAMLRHVYRDAEQLPALQRALSGFEDYLDTVRGYLAAEWVPRRLASAVLGHGLRFGTWQSLAAEGLDEADMVDLVARWVEAVARPAARVRRPATGTAGR